MESSLANDLINRKNNNNNEEGIQEILENSEISQNGKEIIVSQIVDDDSILSEKRNDDEAKSSRDDASGYKMKEKQKILSFILKTEKNIEIQKNNIKQQKKAMQKLFSSGDGFGDDKRDEKHEKARNRGRSDIGEKRAPQIAKAAGKSGSLLTTILNIFIEFFHALLSFFASLRLKKRRKS